MAEDWAGIAGEVTDALASVGFAAVLEVPYITNGTAYDPTQAGWPTEIAVVVVDAGTRARNRPGQVVEQTVRTLMMAVPDQAPQVDWRVQIATRWHRILEVRPLAPGGVDVMFEVDIET